ncbi:MAG TPA: DUF898 domain-containing protein [Gammaproteobacteria bacterium]|nr:DUF898 domain-containing protein [Gammaproteobacteria bacterium]
MDTHTSDEQHTITSTTNPTPEHSIPFEFTGNTNEFFSIWIINVLLTILTLGIYSPWAKVRTYQYFYGNTQLDGASFRYLANPTQILKGRLIALVFFAAYYFSGLISTLATGITIVVIALLIPAMVVMSMSFQLRNTSYRNIKFNFQKNFKRAYTIFAYPLLFVVPYFLLTTYFQSDLQPDAVATENNTETPLLIFLFAALPLLIACLFPLWQHMIIKFKSAHAHFGQTRFNFSGTAGNLYGIYVSAFVTTSLLALLAMIALTGLGNILAGVGNILSVDEAGGFSVKQFTVILLIFLLMLSVYLWMFAYIQTKKTNFIFGNLGIAKHRVQSELEVGTMFYLYVTNTLAIAISLGLLMPWAKIRTARYRAQMTSVIVTGDLDNFFGVRPEGQSAFGEEMGEVFDMGLGV